MIEQNPKEESLLIMNEIAGNPSATQRAISAKLGISLGKTNYILKELAKKGIIEIENFSHNPGKLTKINYILTKKGFKHKVQLLRHFLEIKEKEYNRMKLAWKHLAYGAKGAAANNKEALK